VRTTAISISRVLHERARPGSTPVPVGAELRRSR
jgi:hypothetical protein